MVHMPSQKANRPRTIATSTPLHAHKSSTALVALVAVIVLTPAITIAAEWNIEPRVAIGGIWTDNVALAPDGLEESEWITELRPGITLSAEGRRSSVELDYEMQVLKFSDNSDLDDIYHQLTGAGSTEIIPESLFLDAFTRYGQQNVDTTGRLAFSNLFDTDNRTDFLLFGASPYHVGRWGNWGESVVRYQYHGIRYNNTDPGVVPPEDSETSQFSATLGSPLAARGYSWRTSGSFTKTKFDDADNFEYARTALDLGMPVGPRTRLIGTVGQESDMEEDTSRGSLDSNYWLVGFIWEPSDLQSLEVRGGDRFYGTAWEVRWRRRGSGGELSVDYTEEPTTSSGVLGNDRIFLPGFPTIDIGSLDSRVFLLKRTSGFASYELARSTLSARVYTDTREFLDLDGGKEESYGATLSYDWTALARTLVTATVDLEQRDFESGRQDEYVEFSVQVTREISRTLSGVLRLSHFLRNSDVDPDYSANLVSVFLVASF